MAQSYWCGLTRQTTAAKILTGGNFERTCIPKRAGAFSVYLTRGLKRHANVVHIGIQGLHDQYGCVDDWHFVAVFHRRNVVALLLDFFGQVVSDVLIPKLAY